jgi:hypothetical protein
MMSFQEIVTTFEKLSAGQTVDNDMKAVIERFTVLLYDRCSDCDGVNECRRILYTRKNRAIENIPPTSNALLLHIKRATLQARIWRSCLSADAPNLDPIDFGWRTCDDGSYTPIWTTIADVAMHCRELIKCACKKDCRNCKCKRSQLRCTRLCACDGLCETASPEMYEVQQMYLEEDQEADNIIDIVFND